MLNLPLLILAHCFELACSLACVLLTGTLLKNKNLYLFFQRWLYEHIEETWDFYESYPVVSLCGFFFSYLLRVFQWPSQNRELFGLCKNPCKGTRPFLYPARCVGCCDLNIDFKEHKNINKYYTCVTDNNQTISDEASGDLEGSYLKTLTAYKHKVVVLITKQRNISPVLMLHINLRGSMNGQVRMGIGCMHQALINECKAKT